MQVLPKDLPSYAFDCMYDTTQVPDSADLNELASKAQLHHLGDSRYMELQEKVFVQHTADIKDRVLMMPDFHRMQKRPGKFFWLNSFVA